MMKQNTKNRGRWPLLFICGTFLLGLSMPRVEAVTAPVLAPSSSTSPVALPVVVTCADSGAIIHYTLDGSVPTQLSATVVSGSTVYVAKTLTLKANAWVSGTASTTVQADMDITGLVAAGGTHALGLKTNGRVYSWGNRLAGKTGDGVVTNTNRATPALVKKGSSTVFDNSIDLGGGVDHTVAVSATGDVWAFGSNSNGQIGNNTATDASYAVRVIKSTSTTNYLTNCVAASAGDSFSAAVASGTGIVYTWGLKDGGRLGNNTTTGTRPYAGRVEVNQSPDYPDLTGIVDVDCGSDFALAREASPLQLAGSEGRVYVWGGNASGQLGRGNTTDQPRAISMQASAGTPLKYAWDVSCGLQHSAVVRWKTGDSDLQGSVWCAGQQQYGRLGNGSGTSATITYAVKVQTSTGTDLNHITQVACGPKHTLALDDQGFVWCWGNNTSGELGRNNTTQRSTAIQVRNPANTGSLSNIVYIDAGGIDGAGYSLALAADGTLYAWGANNNGQFGNGTTNAGAQMLPLAVTQLNLANESPTVIIAATVIQNSPGSATLVATPADPDEITDVAKVEFLNNGTVIGQSTAAPWSFTWSGVAFGSYSISARVTDRAGNTGLSSPTNVTFINYLPTVTLAATVVQNDPGSVSLVATPTDQDGISDITKVEFLYNGSVIGQSTTAPWSFTWTGFQFGTYQITARVTDYAGNTALSSPSTFTTKREVSVVSLNSTIAENGSGSGTIRIVVSTPPTAPMTVSYLIGGTATIGSDYLISGSPNSTVIPAGAGFADIFISPLADDLYEGGETVTFTLSASSDYVVSSSANSAQTQLSEPSTAAPPYFFPPSGTPARVDTVCVRSGDTATTVYYTLDGTTPSTSSSSISANTVLRIPRGATVKAFTSKSGQANSSIVQASYPGVASVFASDDASFFVDRNGSVLGAGWGDNDKFGIPAWSFSSRSPERLHSLITNVVQAAGNNHCLFLKASGEVLAAGNNVYGQMGNGTTDHQIAPLTVPGLPSDIVSIAAATGTSFAVTSSGAVYAWGLNTNGQLGLGNTTSPVKSPTLVTSITNVGQVTTGGLHTLFLKKDGTVFATGFGNNGSLGTGTTANSNVPVQTGGTGTPLTGIVQIGANSTCSYALGRTGVVYRWGQTIGGGSNLLVPGATPLTGIVSFSYSNQYNIYAVNRDGDARAYGQVSSSGGEYANGQFGNGTNVAPVNNPGAVLNMSASLAVSGGNKHILGIKKDGSVWSWGYNVFGQLGQPLLPISPEASSNDYTLATPDMVWPASDDDHDGIPDWLDPDSGTGTVITDVNGNGVPDGIEWNAGYSATWDSDGDGISNVDELREGTNPFLADTDRDGVNDNLDAFPLDPTRSSNAPGGSPDTTPPTITLVRPAEAIQL